MPFLDINAYNYASNNGQILPSAPKILNFACGNWYFLSLNFIKTYLLFEFRSYRKSNELQLKPLKNYIDLTHQKLKVLRFQKVDRFLKFLRILIYAVLPCNNKMTSEFFESGQQGKSAESFQFTTGPPAIFLYGFWI